ncbi:unnamed protein product [Mytilus coruscus]|uniref:Uncharacterized protein n=1 Tax=Mytilus coruscus TaxID=42192 RepID=A0A6J8BPB7_MYTCO|nr:unnamed protein product [Mytilus coruscus]
MRGSRVVVNGSSSDNRSPRSVHRKQYSKGDDRKRSQNSHAQIYRRSRSPADFNNGRNDRYKHSEQWSSTGSPRRHRASDLVTEAVLNICGIDSRYVPDHSFLKCSVNLQSVGVVEDFDKDERCRANVHLKKYDLRKIPLDFLKSDETQTLLLQTIKDIEDSVVSQDNLNSGWKVTEE